MNGENVVKAEFGIIMIMIIMDGSRLEQIFPSRKLNALAHTIHRLEHH